jgi:hypothetical protein
LNFTVKLTRLTKFLVGLETLLYGVALVSCVDFFFLWSSVHLYPLIMVRSFSFAVLLPYSGVLLMTMILNLNLTRLMLFIAQCRYKKAPQSRSSNGITLDTRSAVDLFNRRVLKNVSVPLMAF